MASIIDSKKTKEMEKVERRRRMTDAVLRQMALQAATLLGAGTGNAGLFSQ